MNLKLKLFTRWLKIEKITTVFQNAGLIDTYYALVHLDDNYRTSAYISHCDTVELTVDPMPELININNTLFHFTKKKSYTNYIWFKPDIKFFLGEKMVDEMYCLIVDDNSSPIIFPSQLLSHYFKVKDI